jgi:hypothetical protein
MFAPSVVQEGFDDGRFLTTVPITDQPPNLVLSLIPDYLRTGTATRLGWCKKDQDGLED